MRHFILLALAPLLGGCVVSSLASTAVDVVTLPVKAAASGLDAVTTSQAEADQKRGREARKAEERAGREARARDERCRQGRPLPADRCPERR